MKVEHLMSSDGDSALVELWNGMQILNSRVSVTVASADGWNWALAWLQIGFTEMICVPIGEKATEQLFSLQQHPTIGPKLVLCRDEMKDNTTIKILCFHISSSQVLDDIRTGYLLELLQSNKERILFVSVPTTKTLPQTVRAALPFVPRWHQLRHTSLGGLTTARMYIGWTPLPTEPALEECKYPERPLGRFLEPAARAVRWRDSKSSQVDCWYPFSDNPHPYPWPWATGPTWVDVFSVYFGKHIQRQDRKSVV